jgi:hypothetical protein
MARHQPVPVAELRGRWLLADIIVGTKLDDAIRAVAARVARPSSCAWRCKTPNMLVRINPNVAYEIELRSSRSAVGAYRPRRRAVRLGSDTPQHIRIRRLNRYVGQGALAAAIPYRGTD